MEHFSLYSSVRKPRVGVRVDFMVPIIFFSSIPTNTLTLRSETDLEFQNIVTSLKLDFSFHFGLRFPGHESRTCAVLDPEI